jgi:lipopolysaccharide transport system ATP-binding protein
VTEPIIKLENVGVRYRKRKSWFRHDYHDALKEISFELYSGETLGIIGHNGAGKSTLLKVLSGIYAPDVGSIINNSMKTSLLTLNVGFDQNLNGKDNAIISGMLLGYSKQQVYSQIDNIENYCELGDFFYEPIKTYSSGMRARLGFATAAFLRPEILLIDEVLGVGDASFRKKATLTMKNMIKSDQSIVLVSHSENTIKRLCDRVIALENGRVREERKN